MANSGEVSGVLVMERGEGWGALERWGGAGFYSRSSGHRGVGELAGVGETTGLGGASWLGRCGASARVSWTSRRGQARSGLVAVVTDNSLPQVLDRWRGVYRSWHG